MESGNSNIIHVVLTVYDPKGTYSQHAGVVMASIFERTQSQVCVHILHDETMTERNRSFLTETARTFSQKVEFHDVSAYIKHLGDEIVQIAENTIYSVGMLFRLAITDVMTSDRVIYLDCDVVVNMDIRELWDIPVDDCSCAGAPDNLSRFSSTAFRMRIMGCDPRNYINSGVLLMNIPRMKEKLDVRQVCRWFARYRYCMKFPDQDLINSCFRGEIKFLEGRFNNRYANLNATFCDDIHASGVADSILHATVTKPWESPKGSAVDRLYWRAFHKTPWGKLPREELFDLIFDLFQKSPFMHRRSSQCYRKVFHRLRKDIFQEDFFKTAALLLKILSHEAKYLFLRGESKKI